jgi:AraC family transcriptional regulator
MWSSNKTFSPSAQRGDGDDGVRRGIDSYARALGDAGGSQVEALMRGGDGHGVGVALYMAPPYHVDVPAMSVSRLSVSLTNTRTFGALGGEKLRAFDARRYALYLSPAGAPMTFCKDAPSRHVNIYFHPDVFDEGDDVAPSLAVPQPLFNLAVPGIRGLADRLVDELHQPTMLNADAADSLARMLLVQVARHLRRATVPSRALHATTLARLRDYVMTHLSERILVADLAREAGLSLDRFALAYKEQTGRSPHQAVLALRLAHAADLLRQSKLGLADVAHACGFASQQHLTNAMHRHLGVTPRRLRESAR